MGCLLHKDELIQLHTLLVRVRRHFPEDGAAADAFRDYDDYNVSPQHIHKSKLQHKRAVFLLGKGLAELVPDTSQNGHLAHALDDLARKGTTHALRGQP